MFLVLRIVLVVAAIFWLSPLRPGLETERKMVEAAMPSADGSGISRWIQALETMPPRELAKAAGDLAVVGAKLAEGAAGPSRKAPAERPASAEKR
jgi:hypothetical protein